MLRDKVYLHPTGRNKQRSAISVASHTFRIAGIRCLKWRNCMKVLLSLVNWPVLGKYFWFSSQCSCQEGVSCHCYFIENTRKIHDSLHKKGKITTLKLYIFMWIQKTLPENMSDSSCFLLRNVHNALLRPLSEVLKICVEFIWEVKSQFLLLCRKISIKKCRLFAALIFSENEFVNFLV